MKVYTQKQLSPIHQVLFLLPEGSNSSTENQVPPLPSDPNPAVQEIQLRGASVRRRGLVKA